MEKFLLYIFILYLFILIIDKNHLKDIQQVKKKRIKKIRNKILRFTINNKQPSKTKDFEGCLLILYTFNLLLQKKKLRFVFGLNY